MVFRNVIVNDGGVASESRMFEGAGCGHVLLGGVSSQKSG